MRESGVFSTVIASASTNMSKDRFLSTIANTTSPRAVASETLPSRKFGRNKESQATARKALEIELDTASHIAAVPPLSPPGMDDEHLMIEA